MDTITKAPLWLRWKEAQHLALLAAFEDSITGARVKGFCQDFARDLGAKCRITEHVWLFSTLRLPELREIAAEEAAASDLIILSLRSAENLPEEVMSWIDLWQRQKARRPRVLLALIDPDDEPALTAVQAYLQKVASRGGMEFLVEAREVLESRWQGR
jgi:hypothetical protein